MPMRDGARTTGALRFLLCASAVLLCACTSAEPSTSSSAPRATAPPGSSADPTVPSTTIAPTRTSSTPTAAPTESPHALEVDWGVAAVAFAIGSDNNLTFTVEGEPTDVAARCGAHQLDPPRAAQDGRYTIRVGPECMSGSPVASVVIVARDTASGDTVQSEPLTVPAVASTTVAALDVVTADRVEFARLAFGSGPAQVGRLAGEGEPFGPSALTIDEGTGLPVVVDAANERVVVVDAGGVVRRAVDLDVSADGYLADAVPIGSGRIFVLELGTSDGLPSVGGHVVDLGSGSAVRIDSKTVDIGPPPSSPLEFDAAAHLVRLRVDTNWYPLFDEAEERIVAADVPTPGWYPYVASDGNAGIRDRAVTVIAPFTGDGVSVEQAQRLADQSVWLAVSSAAADSTNFWVAHLDPTLVGITAVQARYPRLWNAARTFAVGRDSVFLMAATDDGLLIERIPRAAT